MFRASLKWLPAVLLILLLGSCSNYLMKQEEERQRSNLGTAIVNSSQRTFTITVYPAKNLTKNTEIEYISKATAEIIANYIRPLQNEFVFIPYEYKTNQEICDLILATNSAYSNYTTNIQTVTTQYLFNVFTNYQTNYVGKTNWNERFIQKKKTREMEVTIETNPVLLVTTNIAIGGISKTNEYRLTEELFRKLVDTEFPELTNSLSRIPITVLKDLTSSSNMTNAMNAMNNTNFSTNLYTNYTTSISPVVATNVSTNLNTAMTAYVISTNISTNINTNNVMTVGTNVVRSMNNNFSFIYGNFTAIQNKNGPNDIQLKLTVTKNIVSNQDIHLSLNTREDFVSDKLYDLLKPIRKFILDRPTGDVILFSDPEKANIYMDGNYIGKSPLYYPAVPVGPHQFTFLKPGFSQVTVKGEILENRTNVITKTISKLKTGGIVQVDSDPTNANVFVESSYVGNTPLTMSNLTLNVDHRVKIMNTDTNLDLPPYYHSFRLKDTEDRYHINANLVPNEALDSFVKQALWWSTIGCWGVTLGFVGLNIYSHYQSEYFYDMYTATTNTRISYYNNYLYYYNLDTTSMSGIVISTLVSLGVTGIMLYNNEIYLGMYYNGKNDFYACAAVRF